MSEGGKDFDVAQSISAQIPFFACPNSVIEKGIQEDIRRYVYCTTINVPPYEGDYGKQPALWVDNFFIIKSALAKNEKRIIDGSRKNWNKIYT